MYATTTPALDRSVVEEIVELAQDGTRNWDAEIGIRDDYNGRGMFGSTCFGIVGPRNFGYAFIAAAASVLGPEIAMVLAGKVESDSMGYDTIFYFPGVTIGDA